MFIHGPSVTGPIKLPAGRQGSFGLLNDAELQPAGRVRVGPTALNWSQTAVVRTALLIGIALVQSSLRCGVVNAKTPLPRGQLQLQSSSSLAPVQLRLDGYRSNEMRHISYFSFQAKIIQAGLNLFTWLAVGYDGSLANHYGVVSLPSLTQLPSELPRSLIAGLRAPPVAQLTSHLP